MSYLFSFLVAANAALMGYYLFLDKGDKVEQSVVVAKLALTKPTPFVNRTGDIPPEIGERKQ